MTRAFMLAVLVGLVGCTKEQWLGEISFPMEGGSLVTEDVGLYKSFDECRFEVRMQLINEGKAGGYRCRPLAIDQQLDMQKLLQKTTKDTTP